jgi:small nuclear ribonucleoprotein (snRNP)-like protein
MITFPMNVRVWIILKGDIHYHGEITEQDDMHFKMFDKNNKEVIISKEEIKQCLEE